MIEPGNPKAATAEGDGRVEVGAVQPRVSDAHRMQVGKSSGARLPAAKTHLGSGPESLRAMGEIQGQVI